MGWTSYHRDKGETHAEHFAKELNPNSEILESASKGGTFYAAVRNKETGEVWALVILFRWAPRSYFNFTTKWMDETVGPCESECPEKILQLLTPTDSQWANEWRERCRKNLERAVETRKQRKQVTVGSIIRTTTTLNFKNHGAAQEFKLLDAKRGHWVANPGTDDAFICRLGRDWASRFGWELAS
jgi:hypothetical protein